MQKIKYEHKESVKYERSKVIVCMKSLVVVGMTILIFCIICGCVSTSDNYYNGHQLANITSDRYWEINEYCQPYYENITIIAHDKSITRSGFGSKSEYGIAATDKIERFADTLYVYSTLKENQTYRVISLDQMHCGYSEHHVIILDVVQ